MLLITNRTNGVQLRASVAAIYTFFGFHRGVDILEDEDPIYTTKEAPRQNPAGGLFCGGRR